MINDRLLYQILQIDSPDGVMAEAEDILKRISPRFPVSSIRNTFETTLNLFEGRHPHYQACNTKYHDMAHTLETFLAILRLIHGAVIDGHVFTERHISVACIAALFHDAGYLQEWDDTEGTGAKYTTEHVLRSMDFLEYYGPEHGLSDEEIDAGRAMILCTDIAVDVPDFAFPDPVSEFLGKMLAVADLWSQMSDRVYLEKLLLLFQEYREGKVGTFKSESDLLKKTVDFYEFVSHRLNRLLPQHSRYFQHHFRVRWGINEDLYDRAIKKQIRYLKKIADMPDTALLKQLKRSGIVEEMRSILLEFDN
jgi:hypothetical protein